MSLFNGQELSGGLRRELDVVQPVGRRVRSLVIHVSAEHAVVLGELVVYTRGKEVLVDDLLTGEGKLGGVAARNLRTRRSVGEKREVFRGISIHHLLTCTV